MPQIKRHPADFADFPFLDDVALRKRCIRYAEARAMPLGRKFVHVAGLGLIVATSRVVGEIVGMPQDNALSLMMVCIFAYLLLWNRLLRAQRRRLMQEALRLFSSRCIHCGYELAGSRSRICSECGGENEDATSRPA